MENKKNPYKIAFIVTFIIALLLLLFSVIIYFGGISYYEESKELCHFSNNQTKLINVCLAELDKCWMNCYNVSLDVEPLQYFNCTKR